MAKPLADPNIVEAVYKINQEIHQVGVKLLHLWEEKMFLEWHWWINLALAALPWIVWAKVRKKESTYRLLLGGFIVLILSSFLDFVGILAGLWGYNYKIAPMIPPYIPWDFTLLPVTAMLFFQYKSNINTYIKAAVFSALASFIVQPFFTWMGLYNPQNWKHYYSFPIIFVIYLIGNWFVTRDKFEKV